MANVWVSTPVVSSVGLVAGEAMDSGDLVYLATDGKLYLADSDEGTEEPCVGAVYEDAALGDTVSLVYEGDRNDGSSLTIGSQVFLSGTAGGFTQALATTGSTTPQVVGFALTASYWKFAPAQTYLTPA